MSQKELKNTNQPKTAYQLGEYDYSFSFGVPKGFYKVNYSCKKNEVFPRISKPLFRVNLGFFHFILFPDKSNIFCFNSDTHIVGQNAERQKEENNASLSLLQKDKYIRMLRWFEKKGNQLVGESPLPNIELTELQELFQEDSDNLMFECYEIGPQQADYFQQKLNQPLDLESYDYFIDCDAL